MKNKLAQLFVLLRLNDPRYKQLYSLALLIAGFILMKSPADGGTGPY